MGTIILYAIIGYILYRVYRGYMRFQRVYYQASQFRNFTLTYETMRESELGLLIALVAKVAKSDGRVDELEAELVGNVLDDISKVFPDRQKAKNLLKEVFNIEKENLSNAQEVASKLYLVANKDRFKLTKMMEFLVNLAYCDGKLDSAEDDILRRIAMNLHIGDNELNNLYSRFENVRTSSSGIGSVENAYKILGVNSDDDMKTIKKAYRELVKKYHPDIIQAHGADESYVEQATEKIQEINSAYELVKKVKKG